MNVLIKESHPLTACGIQRVLDSEFENVTINLATNLKDVLSFFNKLQYDLFILDTELPFNEMENLIKFVKKQHKSIQILVFGTHKNISNELKYIAMGASGFIRKSSSLHQIVLAINLIKQGQLYLSQEAILNRQFPNLNGGSLEKRFSKREFEVFKLLIEGFGVNDISKKMELKQTTVSTLKRRVLNKAKVTNIVQLVKLASEYGYS